MNKKVLILYPALVLFVLLFSLSLSGCSKENGEMGEGVNGPSVNVQGVWSGSAQQTGSPNPTFTLQLNTKEADKVWGTITSMDGTFEKAILSGGKITDNKLTFSATANGSNERSGHTYSFEAKVLDQRMEGIWKDIRERSWGTFTVNRKVEQEKAKE
jgi:hypothetical protein